MTDRISTIPPIVADMIHKLADKTLAEAERDNVCYVLENIESVCHMAVRAYREKRGRENEDDRRARRRASATKTKFSRVGQNQR